MPLRVMCSVNRIRSWPVSFQNTLRLDLSGVYYVAAHGCYAGGSNSDVHTLAYNVFVRVEIEPSLRYPLYLHSLTSPSPPFPS